MLIAKDFLRGRFDCELFQTEKTDGIRSKTGLRQKSSFRSILSAEVSQRPWPEWLGHRWQYALECDVLSSLRQKFAQDFCSRQNNRIITVEIGQGHGVYVLCTAQDAVEIRLLEGERCVRGNKGSETEVPGATCRGFDRIIGAYADDGELINTAHSQPALERRVDERIWDVFLDDMFMW